MLIGEQTNKRGFKCRECGKYYKKVLEVVFSHYAPHNRSWGKNPLYFCVDCLKTLRREIDALTILVKTGMNTQ